MSFPVRLGAALLSAFFTATALWNLAYAVWKLTPCGDFSDDGCVEAYDVFRRITMVLQWAWAFLWLGAWGRLEARARRCDDPRRHARLLSHLRYGPLAALAFSILFVLAYDVAMIHYSRWQVVRYIHGSAPPSESPALELHNNYRGFCGNGISSHEYWLYGETAADEFDSPDPAVRVRALHAGSRSYDWLNDPGDGPFVEMVAKGLRDSDPLVRQIAAEYNAQLHGPPSCQFRF